jgi:hypothetical protein
MLIWAPGSKLFVLSTVSVVSPSYVTSVPAAWSWLSGAVSPMCVASGTASTVAVSPSTVIG